MARSEIVDLQAKIRTEIANVVALNQENMALVSELEALHKRDKEYKVGRNSQFFIVVYYVIRQDWKQQNKKKKKWCKS